MKTRLLLLAVVLFLAACNAPPLYETNAREFLEKNGASKELAEKLAEVKPLTADESAQLVQYKNDAVLHLLARNPSIPAPLLERLCNASSEEIRWGAALNPSIPVDYLLKWKTSAYSTMNTYIAQNPRLPVEVIREMFEHKTAGNTSIALNPNCPVDIMQVIATKGSDVDRSWLATNPNLPPEIVAQLQRDPDPGVRSYLEANKERRANASPNASH